MPHTKILGWLWLLFGGFWTVLIIWLLLTGATSITPNPPPGITYSAYAWWEEFAGNVIEYSFFFASALLGVALLRRWRGAQAGLGIVGAVLLAIWVLLIVSPWSPPSTLGERLLWLGPLLALSLYSLAATLVPNSQINLSRRSRFLIASGSLFGVLAAIGFHLWAFRNVPSGPAEARAPWQAETPGQ